MREDDLRRIWQERTWVEPLVTTHGQKLTVISTGIPGEAVGPDFRDAALLLDGHATVTGDVEIHLKSSDWSAHGHSKDPTYNNVRLHVVWEQNGDNTARLQNGLEVTTLVLSKPIQINFSPPCLETASVINKAELLRLLKGAGECRFRLKGQDILKAMEVYSPLEVLYQGIMEALGYSSNSKPFLQLACNLPLAVLTNYGAEIEPEEAVDAFQGVLLGAAGLLPPGSDQPIQYERYWWSFLRDRSEQWNHAGRGMGSNEAAERCKNYGWDLRGRPHNSPVRRLAGAGALLARNKHKNIIERLISLLVEDLSNPVDILEKALEIKASGYWSVCWDFARPLQGVAPALIGRGRARVIVVNIVLPFLWAFGTAEGHTVLTAMAMDAFSAWPKSDDDRIIRHMQNKLGMTTKSFNGLKAVHQAGMHHLYRNRCVFGKCGECSIYKALESNSTNTLREVSNRAL